VVAVDQQAAYRISDQSGSGIRSWQLVPLPGDRPPSRLIGLSPDARTLAVAIGELQARPFDLVLLDLASGTERSIEVARGLDGPPIWIGASIVAVHAILDNQRSGFTFVDIPTGAATDVPSYGVALAASADGSRVAFDDGKTGEVLVGGLADMNDAGLVHLTRLANESGSGVDHVALSADGQRLAIVRRTDGATAIELFVAADAAWRPAGAFTIPGEGPVSIAWLG
jgi:hypothetical protein